MNTYKTDELNCNIPNVLNECILANIISDKTGGINYVTRSVTAHRKLLDGEKTNDNATKAESVSETQAIADKIGDNKSNENKDEKIEIVQGESAIDNSGGKIIKEKAKRVPYEQSNFDVTI